MARRNKSKPESMPLYTDSNSDSDNNGTEITSRKVRSGTGWKSSTGGKATNHNTVIFDSSEDKMVVERKVNNNRKKKARNKEK